MSRLKAAAACGIVIIALFGAGMRPTDDLDAFVEKEMARREIVGLSLAIIDDGKIVDVRAYGTTTRGGSVRVTPNTLFQAGSISKPVAALAALQLVERGKLSLDEDVNTKLASWKVPDNEFTTTERVTLRRLLSHSAGLTVHGFPGYAVTERMPSVPEVLDGKGNTAAVRVNVVPGTIWRYSGGGYTVMQQLVTDVTGVPFPAYLRDNVLLPLGMTNSTYQQPLPADLASKTASGYYTSRAPVEGRWHVYPEMAAAGLWTTATDLARYAVGVQQAVAGKSKVLSAQMAKQMLTVQKGTYGLGPAIEDTGAFLRFGHGGRDEGFDALVVAYANGDGLALMTNANDNSRARSRIVNFIAKKYKWPNFPVPNVVPPTIEVAMIPAELSAIAGRYEFQNNNLLTLIPIQGKLFVDVHGLPDEEFVAVGNDEFASRERPVSFKAVRNAAGQIDAIEWTQNNQTRRIARMGPLFESRNARDPDPSFTGTVLTVLGQLSQGGAAVSASTLLTAGARGAFTAANSEMNEVRGLTFVHAEDVVGRNVERHGHAIGRVLHYRMNTAAGERLLLVHVDPNGLVADYDLVMR